ncbi:MAG: tandem-95 repeat protein, partial [Sphingorhabdus sp.]
MSGEAVQYVRYDGAGVVIGQSSEQGFQRTAFGMEALVNGGMVVLAVDLISVPNDDGSSSYVTKAVLRFFDAAGQMTNQAFVDTAAFDDINAGNTELTVLPNGNVVATWIDFDNEVGGLILKMQVFDSSGGAVTGSATVSTDFGGFWADIVGPAVEAFADGSFIMVWNGPAGTLFQLFNADGTAQSPITTLPTDSSYGADFANALVTLPDMTFVIGQAEGAWENGDESGTAVDARQYNRDGTQVGEPITLNITGAGDQSSLHLAATPGGGFTALWLDYGELTSISGSYEPDTVLDVWRRRDFSTGTLINAAPVAQDGAAAGNEDGSIAGQALAADANGDALTYSLISGPAHGTLIFNANGSYVYTPNGDYNGADSFSFQANDGTVASNAATISLTVAAVNDGPTLVNALADQSSAEDAPFSFTVPAGSFADVDGDVLVLTATLGDGSALPSWINFDPATRTFTGTPPANFDGQIDVRVTAADGAGGSVSDQFTLDILPGNDAPTDLELSGTTVAENAADGAVVGTATAIDADSGDTRSYTLVNDAGGRFSIHAATGVLTVTSGALLNFEAASAHAVIIRVTDAAGLSYDESFSIAVTNANEAPDSLTLASGGAVAENSANGTVVGQFA